MSTAVDTFDPALAHRMAEAIRSACIEELLRAHEEAGLLGLCGEGRFEAAVDAVRELDLGAALGTDGLAGADAKPSP